MIHEHLILGAGISGLVLAHKLNSLGKEFLILEKSKGVGGRVATRRINELGIDHGAPYFKSHPALFELLNHFQIPHIKIAHDGVYSDGGMTSLPKKMAMNLPIVKDEKVIRIESLNGTWKCTSEKGNIYQTKKLILTAPLPQALELLQVSKIDFSHHPQLNSIAYTKGVLGIFLTDEEVLIKKALPDNVHSVLSMKERMLNPKAWVIRTTENFSEENFNRSDAENLSHIESLFHECFIQAPVITHRELKKWRYVTPTNVIQSPYLEIQNNLYLIGDGFLFPDIRGALLSAQGLGENLI